MPEIKVIITETRKKSVVINAKNSEEAEKNVYRSWLNGENHPKEEDCVEVRFDAVLSENEIREKLESLFA